MFYTLHVDFNNLIYNDFNKDCEPLHVHNDIIEYLNELLFNNDNMVFLMNGLEYNNDFFSIKDTLENIIDAVRILKENDYFKVFDYVRVYNYNTGLLYRDFKGGL